MALHLAMCQNFFLSGDLSVFQVLDSLSSPSLSVPPPSITVAAEADEIDLNDVSVQCAVPVYIIQVGSDHTLVRSLLSLNLYVRTHTRHRIVTLFFSLNQSSSL